MPAGAKPATARAASSIWRLAAAGAAASAPKAAMSLGVIYLFEQRSLKLWLINSGYQVVAFTAMGGILGGWR